MTQYTNEDTEDIYSSVFLSLIENNFKKLRQFRNKNACSLTTWLTIITSRMTIDYMRKDKRYLRKY
jgi:DNA-directed RNA polymerase specialized sigma24 family protein